MASMREGGRGRLPIGSVGTLTVGWSFSGPYVGTSFSHTQKTARARGDRRCVVGITHRRSRISSLSSLASGTAARGFRRIGRFRHIALLAIAGVSVASRVERRLGVIPNLVECRLGVTELAAGRALQ